MLKIKDNAYGSYTLCKMQERDFDFVKNFLDGERQKLKYIEFFYPYKDEELRFVLSGGCFWGLLDNRKLIATFGIDFDDEYATALANLVNSFNDVNMQFAYESSGLMVAEEYRGRGVAKYMASLAAEEARKRNIAICAVVHTRNVASMSTFFSLGFKLRAVWNMSEGYDFIYLVKRFDSYEERVIVKKVLQSEENDDIIGNMVEVANTDVARHRSLLYDGYVGIGCENTNILFRKE